MPANEYNQNDFEWITIDDLTVRGIDWEPDDDGLMGGPLNRYSQLNPLLSWEVETFSDIPNWSSANTSNSSWTFNVNSRPRRIHAESDGSNSSNNDFGGVQAVALTTFQSLGSFRIKYWDVSWDDSNELRSGISDVSDASTDIFTTGNSIIFDFGDDNFTTINSGTASTTNITSPDWSNNHDVAIEYDGSTAKGFVDGTEEASASFSVNADFRPLLQLFMASSNTNSSTAEIELATVRAP